ncbi:hypothetical protein [Mycolicibacterium llatzerense]|uniref:hypothetical protein n=1 Tax=Mycolicibacterium llatzerense TaxID=280871 RepID=UPI0008DE85E4|nr:hypothetical protein [Mycolicibacterium llatzerense]
MATTIEVSRLRSMDELDRGAFGTVYRLASYHLPGFAELAYKEFTAAPSAAEVTNLTALVEFRSSQDARRRAVLDDAAAWPLQLVTRHGAVCGFVMQLIPSEFFGQQLLPSGRTVRLPIKSQWLVVDPARADGAGIAVPRADDLPARLVLCAKLAHVFGVLHRAGLVYGDLSLNNAMFSAGSPPRMMLVDCDAAQAPGTAAIGQAHTDDWTPPECVAGGRVQDAATDRYKLALFILRVLTPGPHASQSVDPARGVGVLDLEGNAMMRDGVSTDRNARPTAKAWFDYLTRYLGVLTGPPRITQVDVDVSAVLAGSMATVSWQVVGADRVVVTASDGHTITGDATAGMGHCRVAVTRTGPFTLRAENCYGATTVDSRPVFVLDPPTIPRITVAPLALPPLQFGTEHLAAALAGLRPVGPDLAALRMPAFPARSGLIGPALQAATVGTRSQFTELLATLRTGVDGVTDRAVAAAGRPTPP